MKKTVSAEELAAAQAQADSLRARAARQAALKTVGDAAAPEIVGVRVLKHGADKVSMGIHVAGIGDACYEHGEEFQVERPVAEALEARGFVEIQATPAK